MLVSWKEHYNRWMNHEDLDLALKEQLLSIKDEVILKEYFHHYLQFGTAGIRGKLGPGINRLNIYMIRKVAEGLAQYILEHGEEAKVRGVVIAYDNRRKSQEFAFEVAKTLGYHGIQSYVFESLRTTPELSFAVRFLHTKAGVMITASHNPPEYNGLKVYGEDGGQVTSEVGDRIVAKVNEVEDELSVKVAQQEDLEKSGLLQIIGETVDRAYFSQLKSVTINETIAQKFGKDLKIVYTPFHGTGLVPVTTALKEAGFSNVTVVEEQAKPDENFTNAPTPNPEEHAAFELAIYYGKKVGADLLIGTDPDADRMGVAVPAEDGSYKVLTGNQIGAILLDYLLKEKSKQKKLPKNGAMLKSIVTSELGTAIASDYGVTTENVLTGFKYIAEKIDEYHKSGEFEFLFGYEESYGYLIKDFVRDKDAVQACLLMAEVAAFYKAKGMTLQDALISLFEKYGYYLETIKSIRLEGIEGAKKINDILRNLKNDPFTEIGGEKVVIYEDYEAGIRSDLITKDEERIPLPKSKVLKWILENGSWICARPSGTEPLIKFYFGVKGDTLLESENKLATYVAEVMSRVNQ